ncbi:MAG: CocE/NonD family hydrolase [SAR202 cluster bacterium]|nr:CocE/NonD family hydrolase [SAR202 cluster bacterium]
MGANTWRTSDTWPLPGTKYTPYYLHSRGNANTPFGDGSLSVSAPEAEQPDRYDYDPRDPVMTLYSPPGQQEPRDQRALDDRSDVLVYATPPLERAVEVAGPVLVKLFAATSARDTDFTVKLIDVWPSGFAQELCYGIVRARYRESYTEPSLLAPGKVYEYTIQVNPTANLFRPGHRIRVDISSSDFPNFDRNHNTGGNDYSESTLITAHQTVYHDAARLSHIVLPVRPAP